MARTNDRYPDDAGFDLAGFIERELRRKMGEAMDYSWQDAEAADQLIRRSGCTPPREEGR